MHVLTGKSLPKTEKEAELRHCLKLEVEKMNELAMAIENKEKKENLMKIRCALFGAQHKSDKAIVDLSSCSETNDCNLDRR